MPATDAHELIERRPEAYLLGSVIERARKPIEVAA
jgi:hypothetical protein